MEGDRGAAAALTVAAAAGVVAVVLYAAFALLGEPFGSLNDLATGALAFLAGEALWSLRGRIGRGVALLAMAGAVVGVGGSALVLTKTTGWLLAGFVSTVGFGLMGPAVLAAVARLAADRIAAGRLALLGRVAGWALIAGLIAVVPAAMRLDDPATLPTWAWLAFAGWIGGYFAFPAWAFAAGRRLRGAV